jgi:hypothetical protein
VNNAPKTRSPSWTTWWHRAVASALPLMTLAALSLAEPAAAAQPQIVSESPSALATSVQTSAGTWATVPMGHLDQPLNTFWQLFYRARGASSWSNATSTLALATNGGLIIATPDGQSVEVGNRPANRLTFSTLLTASPTQSTWTTGLLPAGLAADNSALATDSLSGGSAALLNDGAGVRAVSSARGLSMWRTLTTEAGLASSPAGRHCGLHSITAVGYEGTQALIGGGCGHAGTVGIFSRIRDRWRPVGPTLPRQLDLGSVNVISLKQTSEGISTILAVTSVKEGTSLVAAWTGSGGQWSVSGALRLSPSQRVLSVGPASGFGVFVLLSEPGGSEEADVAGGPGISWQLLPTLPRGTSTLAFGPTNAVDALAVNDTAFADWLLSPGSGHWVKGQAVNVPIEFGSSG